MFRSPFGALMLTWVAAYACYKFHNSERKYAIPICMTTWLAPSIAGPAEGYGHFLKAKHLARGGSQLRATRICAVRDSIAEPISKRARRSSGWLQRAGDPFRQRRGRRQRRQPLKKGPTPLLTDRRGDKRHD